MPAALRTPRDHRGVVGALLREARAAAGLTQAGLARRLGVPQSFVSKVETGERRLDPVELHVVCRALGVPLVAFAARLEARLAKVGDGPGEGEIPVEGP